MFSDETDIPIVQVSLPGELPDEIDPTKSGALARRSPPFATRATPSSASGSR